MSGKGIGAEAGFASTVRYRSIQTNLPKYILTHIAPKIKKASIDHTGKKKNIQRWTVGGGTDADEVGPEDFQAPLWHQPC